MCRAQPTPRFCRILPARAAGRSGSTGRRSISATCAGRAGRPSSTSRIRAVRRSSPASICRRAGTRTRCAWRTASCWSTTRSSARAGSREFGGGLGIYDVSRPDAPKLISKWTTAGRGVHRYDFDGRYAYISPTAEGYVGNIVMILDLADPARPEEVGRWWIPGQWQGGRRALSLGRLRVAALPPSDPAGRPPLCELLASRLLHPRHRRHVAAEGGRGAEHEPLLSPSHPYLPAAAAAAEGRAQDHGRGGRGCGEAAAGAALLRLDLRHHRRDDAAARSPPSRCRASIRTARRSRR